MIESNNEYMEVNFDNNVAAKLLGITKDKWKLIRKVDIAETIVKHEMSNCNDVTFEEDMVKEESVLEENTLLEEIKRETPQNVLKRKYVKKKKN